jgi:anti-sigma-K factor RskA
MSDDHNTGPDDATPLAAEYVLGVLGKSDRVGFEQRLAAEPALRSEVEYWEQRLGVLASEISAIEPPRETWAKIEATLKTASETRGGIWNSLSFWRWAAIGSAAVAAASIAVLVTTTTAPVSRSTLIAKLNVDGGQAGFVAAIDPARNGLTIVPASVTSASQRALELWLIAPGDKPRSLGLIEPGRAMHINLPADIIQRVTTDATLAVSIEPPGGSPTGQPTGPVIANGKLTNL